MQVVVSNPQQQTWIIMAVLTALLWLSSKKITDYRIFHPSLTNELKGLAILMVIFGHIGYFLATDDHFLQPLSLISGVGVDLFLFLSGLGLTFSQMNKALSVKEFYLRRLKRLYLPMWTVLIIFLSMDYLILGRSYPLQEVFDDFLGWFPIANLYHEINSPLWYFTFILGYYLVFPWIWIKKWPLLSGLLMVLIGYGLTHFGLPIDVDVFTLYKIHYLAFPIGMLMAVFSQKTIWDQVHLGFWRYPMMALLSIVIGYTAVHSGVGGSKEIQQLISLLTMGCIIWAFLLKRREFGFLITMGLYSYEIYLLHWPLLYRYDVLYKNLPAALATLLYLGVFIGLGYLLQKCLKRIT